MEYVTLDRFVKHINELAGSLKEHERAVLLTIYQYEITKPKERRKSTHLCGSVGCGAGSKEKRA